MAKTIKFNLICDEKPVRTIEDLQNNFSIEDVLAYYNNKLLHRWLSVRGYASELEKVSAISGSDPMEIIKELIRIFDVVTDTEKVEESIYMLKYLDERKELCAIYERENYKAKSIIDDYEAGYRRLVDGILENPNDVAVIKANIAEMVSNYAWILKLNHRELFYTLIENDSILAIMCLLMVEECRNYYLLDNDDDNDDDSDDDNDDDDDDDERRMEDRRRMYKELCDFYHEKFYLLERHLHSSYGSTDNRWKNLEPKGKKYMIISMGLKLYVRSAENEEEAFSHDDIKLHFPIVDGIDFKTPPPMKGTRCVLYYMEV